MRSSGFFPFTGVPTEANQGRYGLASALLLAVTLFTALAKSALVAQGRTTGVSFAGLQSTAAIGLGIPHAIAIDGAGDIYVTDLIDSEVLKIPRGATGANCTVARTCTQVGRGFAQPTALAVDASSNVFVTDASTQSLYRITAAGVQTTLAAGLASPSGVALAADGTIFVAVSGAILRIGAAGAVSTFATGPDEPGGIALSPSGKLYLADIGGNRVLAFASGGTQTTLATGLDAPQAVALDGVGNLYITDTGNNRILSVPTSGSGYICPSQCTLLAVQASTPNGLSSDAAGNLYVADTGRGQVVKLAQDADFGASPVVTTNAHPAASLTLNYLLYGSSCTSPPSINVLTRGVTNKDFTYSLAANTCTPGTPDSLAVMVNFAPLSPGLRTGSVEVIDATGVPQVATYLHGVGKGPRITWTPGVLTSPIVNLTVSPAQSPAP